MAEHEGHSEVREKLRLMKSPVVLSETSETSHGGAEMPNLANFGDRYTDNSIQFMRVSICFSPKKNFTPHMNKIF